MDKRNWLVYIVASFFLVSSLPVSALALGSDAVILPPPPSSTATPPPGIKEVEIHVLNLTVDKNTYKAGDTVKGSFTLYNDNTTDVPNVTYTISFAGGYLNQNTPGQLYGQQSPQQAFLSSGQKKVIAFSYVLPQGVAGSGFGIHVDANIQGNLAGWSDATFSITGTNQFLNIATFDVVAGTKQFASEEGPTVTTSDDLHLKVSFFNISKASVSVIPSISIYDRFVGNGSPVASVSQSAITIPAASSTTILFPIDVSKLPAGVYEGQFNLNDKSGQSKAPLTPFRFIVKGTIATIKSIASTATSVKKGSQFTVMTDILGTPFDIMSGSTTATVVSTDLKVFNEKDQLVAEDQETRLALGTELQQTIPLQAAYDAAALRAELTVSDASGTLAEYNVDLSPNYGADKLKAELIEWGIILLVVLICTAFVWYFGRKIKNRKAMANIFLVFLFLGVFGFHASHAEAYTVTQDPWENQGLNGSGWDSNVVGGVYDGEVFQPGQQFTISINVESLMCDNTPGTVTAVLYPLQADGSSGAAETQTSNVNQVNANNHNSYWRPNTFSWTLTAPTVPGTYYMYLGSYWRQTLQSGNTVGSGQEGYVTIVVSPIPTTPTVVQTIGNNSTCQAVSIGWSPVSGATQYEILRSTSPNGPFTQVGTSSSASSQYAYNPGVPLSAPYVVSIHNQNIYVDSMYDQDSLAIFNISTPSNPVLSGPPQPAWTSTYGNAGWTNSNLKANFYGTLAFIGQYGFNFFATTSVDISNLQQLDLSDPNNPIPLNSYSPYANSEGINQKIFSVGNYIYTLSSYWNYLYQSTIYRYQVFDPFNNFNVKSFFGGAWNYFDDFTINGNYLYQVVGATFSVYDISNPSSPSTLYSSNTAPLNQYDQTGFASVGSSYGYVYVLVDNTQNNNYGYDPQLDVIDVSDPTYPVLVSTTDLSAYFNTNIHNSRSAQGIYISGNYAYIMGMFENDQEEGVQIVDVSNPAAPIVDGCFHIWTNPGYFSGNQNDSFMSVFGTDAYVAIPPWTNVQTPGLEVVDISNPVTPVIIKTILYQAPVDNRNNQSLATNTTYYPYVDTTPTANTTYYYEIVATNSYGNSNPTTQNVSAVSSYACPVSCTGPDGSIIQNGSSKTYYSSTSSTSCPAISENRTCTNGTLSGSNTYNNASCATLTCSNGGTNYPACTVNTQGNCLNGFGNPPLCNTCPSNETLVSGTCIANCTNGANDPPLCDACPLGQTFTGGSCQADCTSVNMKAGQSATYYSIPIASPTQTCSANAEIRTCVNGSLNGSATYQYTACSPFYTEF